MQNDELVTHKSFGVFAMSVITLGVFGTVYRNRRSILSLKNETKAISEEAQKYIDLVSETGNDIEQIEQYMLENNEEILKYEQEAHKIMSENVYTINKETQYCQPKKNINLVESLSKYSELLEIFIHLKRTYPEMRFQPEQELTLEMIKEKCTKYEEHHQKLLIIGSELMGISTTLVRYARSTFTEIKDLENQFFVAMRR